MSQNLLMNNIANRSTVVGIVQDSYDMDSVKNVVKYSIESYMGDTTFPVVTSTINGNYDHSVNLTSLVLDSSDIVSIRNDVLEILRDDLKYADVYISFNELRLGDFCEKELNSIVCDSTRGFLVGTLSIENKDRREVYNVRITNIGGEVLNNTEFGIVVDDIDIVINRESINNN